jgi:hypothetical protein
MGCWITVTPRTIIVINEIVARYCIYGNHFLAAVVAQAQCLMLKKIMNIGRLPANPLQKAHGTQGDVLALISIDEKFSVIHNATQWPPSAPQ